MEFTPEVPPGYRLLSGQPPAPSWGLASALSVLGIWIVASLAFAFPLLVWLIDTPPLLLVASVALPTVIMAATAVLIAQRRGHGAVRDFRLELTPRALGVGLTTGLAMLIGASAIAALMRIGSDEEIPVAAGDVFSLVADSPLAVALLIFTIAVVAPIGEEIAYRGMLYSALQRRWSATVAVIFSSIIFAALHFEPQRFPILLGLGLALGELRRRTDSTSATIVAHMLINSVASLGLVVSLSQ